MENSHKRISPPLPLILSWVAVMLCLLSLTGSYSDGSSDIYFHSCNNPGFGISENYASLPPVIVGDRLYVCTFTTGQTFRLWQTHLGKLPADSQSQPFDPNIAWGSEIDVKGIHDPNTITITAMCAYKDYLYMAVQTPEPGLWRLEDPNEPGWESVAPAGLYSGEIEALAVFDQHLYLEVLDPDATGYEKVNLWRSMEAIEAELNANDWETVNTLDINQYQNVALSSFEEFNGRLYLGTENAGGSEIWRLDRVSVNPIRLSSAADGFGDISNQSIPAMAVARHILYTVTRNTYGPQFWFCPEGEESFRRISTPFSEGYSPEPPPLSLESLGSYLFLGLDASDEQIWRLNAASQWKFYEENQWDEVAALNYDDDQLLLDANNRLNWIYADPNEGYLYLGTQSVTQGMKLWQSTRLPVITIDSPHPLSNAFHEDFPIRWKTTKSGSYIICLLEFTDPNQHSSDNPLSVQLNRHLYEPAVTASEEQENMITASHLSEGEGIYLGEISWDPNRNPPAKSSETYPARLSFIYDTTAPSEPVLIKVSPGTRKLKLWWTGAVDNLSGVDKYRIWYKEMLPEEDPNMVTFAEDESREIYITGEETEFILDHLINGQPYAVAVSALDVAGNESFPSSTLSGTPEVGRGITDLVDEDGECFIDVLMLKGLF
ncbi:MAG: hypothetical protein ACMUIA_08175 [bacterium]